jgi:alkanesulfonate monooxygenase SsuD/methylene tetrahydromethanopterin reductase-like flavin-dependent oxidoreductase (luciferase family)
MRNVKFGARIPISGPVSNSKRLIESTREAEDLGYDAVFIVDHIHNSFERHKQYPVGMGSYRNTANTLDPQQFETVAAFSFLAGTTRKIEFGVGVMPLPLREPIVLAKELATMDALSGGRFIFGVGVSNVSDKEEYRAMGKPFSPYADRYEMIGEYIAAMRAIWENPKASFHGKYVGFDNLTIYPKPARRIPVWVGCYTLAGGKQRPAVKFALDHADGWMYGFLMTPGRVKSMIQDSARPLKKLEETFQTLTGAFSSGSASVRQWTTPKRRVDCPRPAPHGALRGVHVEAGRYLERRQGR